MQRALEKSALIGFSSSMFIDVPWAFHPRYAIRLLRACRILTQASEHCNKTQSADMLVGCKQKVIRGLELTHIQTCHGIPGRKQAIALAHKIQRKNTPCAHAQLSIATSSGKKISRPGTIAFQAKWDLRTKHCLAVSSPFLLLTLSDIPRAASRMFG